jgi:hypothetical protein
MEGSLILGIAVGLGLPSLGGLFILVRMENRVTALESARVDDEAWRRRIEAKLDRVAENVNRMIGAGHL